MATGIARSGFDIDLRDGVLSEQAFARLLMQQEVFTIEHKMDEKFQKTGNVFIEYSQLTYDGDRVPSGIAVTTADAWAIEFRPGWRIFGPMSELKQIAREAFKRGYVKHGGDSGCYSGCVFPFYWLIRGLAYVKRLPYDRDRKLYDGPHQPF